MVCTPPHCHAVKFCVTSRARLARSEQFRIPDVTLKFPFRSSPMRPHDEESLCHRPHFHSQLGRTLRSCRFQRSDVLLPGETIKPALVRPAYFACSHFALFHSPTITQHLVSLASTLSHTLASHTHARSSTSDPAHSSLHTAEAYSQQACRSWPAGLPLRRVAALSVALRRLSRCVAICCAFLQLLVVFSSDMILVISMAFWP